MKRSAIALLIAITVSLLFAGQALAHALLLRSSPTSNATLSQPPAAIELWFSEPLEEGFSAARLLNSAGDEIPLGAQTVDVNDRMHLSAPLNPLPPGIYTVSWTTLSQADGHPFSGSFPFTVLHPDGSRPTGTAVTPDVQERGELPTPLQTVARWLALTGSILLMGVALFLGYTAAEWMKNDSELAARLNRLGFRLLLLAVVALVLGSWLQLITQLENLSQLPRLIVSTYGGALNLARQAFAVTSLLIYYKLNAYTKSKNISPPRHEVTKISFGFLKNLVPWWLRGEKRFCSPGLSGLGVFQPLSRWRRRILQIAAVYALALVALIAFTAFQNQWAIAVPALVLLGSLMILPKRLTLLVAGAATLLYFSLGSHAGAVPGSFWAIAFDIMHLLATSAWAGGLMLLPLMLRQCTDLTGLRPLFSRYGQVAKLSFFVLWATGLFSTLVQVPDLESLFNTGYGQVLLIKIALMLAVWGVSMAGARLFRGKPAPEQMSVLMGRFTRFAAAAAWAALVLMLAVAVLVQTQPPPRPESTSEYRGNIISADDLDIQLQVSPAQIGMNQFYIQLAHPDRSSVGDVQLVRLTFEDKDAQLGQSKIEMQPLGPNRYWAEGTFLNHPGNWEISVYVRRRGMDDVIVQAGTLILSAPSTRKNPFQMPVTSIPVGGLFAGTLLLLGLETLRWRKTFQQAHPNRLPLFLTIAWGLITLGVMTGCFIFLYAR